MNALRRRFQPEQIRELVLIALIIGIIIFFGTQIENYFSPRTFTRISTSVAVVPVVAVGQTLVILTRNIDLSVGSIVGFTAYVVGTILSMNNDIPPVAAVLLAIALGAVMGSINGVLVAYGRVPAIIVTLGTLASTARSWWRFPAPTVCSPTNCRAGWSTCRRSTFQLRRCGHPPALFDGAGRGDHLPTGGELPALGPPALRHRLQPGCGAKVAGFPAQRIVFTAFVLSGALAGLAGFMFLARFGNITVVAGQGVELQSVAAAVVGGVNINGGLGIALRRVPGRDPHRRDRQQPDPLAGDQRILARRAARPADPAGGGHRHGDHEPAAQGVVAPRAAGHRQQRATGREGRRRLCGLSGAFCAVGKGCCSSC
jgi:rhamnose transport system permease protein